MTPTEQATEFIEVDLPVNNLIYSTYQHFPYQPWDAFNELIDNSTQSFFDHRNDLQARVRVAIEYGPVGGEQVITVWDDAFGMDEETIRRAVRLAEPPPDTSGRCEFGMGMKTACCWFGDLWSVQTKQMGHPFEYTFEMNVPLFANSPSNRLKISRTAKAVEDHYTKISISQLHRGFKTRTLGKLKDRLGMAYKRDISSGDLELRFNGELLGAEDLQLLTLGGKEVRRDLDFVVNGHRITGWAGLLAKKSGASLSGFNIYRRGRLIMPHQKFFGPGLFPDVATNVVSQRLAGELDLDTLPAVHLKNAIDLKDLQEAFEQALAEQIKDVRAQAVATKYSKVDDEQKSEHIRDVVEDLLSKDDVVEQLQVADDLKGLEISTAPINDTPGQRKPLFERLLPLRDGVLVRVYLNTSNPMDMYMRYIGNPTQEGVDIEMNTAHPYIAEADDEAFDMFLQIGILEGLAEWLSDRGEHNPALARRVRMLKDQLMRSHDVQFGSYI